MQSSAVQTAMMYDIPLINQLLLREKEQKFLVKKILIIQKALPEWHILKMMQK